MIKTARWFQRRRQGFTLIEMVIVLAALSILGGVAVTTTVGAVRDANVEATTQGVELMAQWRSQIVTYNRQGTINCWNTVDLSTTCNGGGAPNTVPIPTVLNEGRAMFWPVTKARWSLVCDAATYPDHFRRVTTILGNCDPAWDTPFQINAPMQGLAQLLPIN